MPPRGIDLPGRPSWPCALPPRRSRALGPTPANRPASDRGTGKPDSRRRMRRYRSGCRHPTRRDKTSGQAARHPEHRNAPAPQQLPKAPGHAAHALPHRYLPRRDGNSGDRRHKTAHDTPNGHQMWSAGFSRHDLTKSSQTSPERRRQHQTPAQDRCKEHPRSARVPTDPGAKNSPVHGPFDGPAEKGMRHPWRTPSVTGGMPGWQITPSQPPRPSPPPSP